ncbi:MAG: Ig-like domain-containing protein, partial [Pirellulales bacterium]
MDPSRSLQLTQAQFPGREIRDIVLDPDDWQTAYVMDDLRIFYTADAGRNWGDITGNLPGLGPGELRRLEYIESGDVGALVIAADTGVFMSMSTDPGNWTELGPNLPNAPVYDIEYDKTDDILVTGLLGRGAWTLEHASSAVLLADFAPGSGGPGEPPLPPPPPSTGAVSGIKWNDLDGDGERDADEPGLGGVFIYADLDESGWVNVGEPSVLTAADGSYTLDGLVPGDYVIREIVGAGFVQTFPNPSVLNGHQVTVVSGETVPDINFGNRVSRDYGDLPDIYRTLNASGGPSHGVSTGFRLGELVDGEDDGVPTVDALGDDNAGSADEDGVLFASGLAFGETAEIVVFASNDIGFLSGWMDFNADGDFDDAGEKIIDGVLLVTGTNFVSFAVPAAPAGVDADDFTTYARFRYGVEPTIGPSGPALFGEVEDYRVEIPMPPDNGLRAADDEFEVDEDSTNVALTVLANDMLGPAGGTLVVTAVGPTSEGGTATTNGGSSILYTPAPDFFGTETFVYTIEDGIGGVKQAEVTVHVAPVNDDPTAVDDMIDVAVGGIDVFLDVLSNDSILPDVGEMLTINGVDTTQTMGTLTLINSNTAVRYTPPADFDGIDTFEYTISDGNGGTDTALVTLNVRPLPPAVEIMLEATDTSGTPIDTVNLGETFQVRAYVEDLTSAPTGVFSSYFDVTYAADFVSLNTADTSNPLGFDIEFGPDYGNRTRGDGSTSGLIDEAGATDGSSPLGPGQFLLFTVEFTAEMVGEALFGTNEADMPGNETTLFGALNVLPSSQILFGSTMVTIGGFAANGDTFVVVGDSTD